MHTVLDPCGMLHVALGPNGNLYHIGFQPLPYGTISLTFTLFYPLSEPCGMIQFALIPYDNLYLIPLQQLPYGTISFTFTMLY